MADIFTPWKLGRLELLNRLVRSATWEGMAGRDGTPSDELASLTADLARGGVGLIITGYAFIAPEGRGLPKQTGVYSDTLITSLRRMTEAVHREGGKVALQIVHAGGQTQSDWIGTTPLGPSRMVHPSTKEQVEELSREQIAALIEAFAAAAARAKQAGFDAVQLHAAHGYLINQFLSPNTNQRTDDYGGSRDNRARFCYQVFRAVRETVGPDYPVFIKLNIEDCIDDGLEPSDAVEVAKELSAMGIDAIEVSGGVPAAGEKGAARRVRKPSDEGYFLANARAVKAAVVCPVIVVGGFRSLARVSEALESVDAVAMARPYIRQPDLANLWREGKTDRADCISCGRCFAVTMNKGLGCGDPRNK